MSKAEPDTEPKRYSWTSIRVVMHIPGVGIDGICRDIPIVPFTIDTDAIYYEPGTD